MSASYDKRVSKFLFAMAICVATTFTICQGASAQFGRDDNLNLFGGVVGGVHISTEGVLDGDRTALADDIRQRFNDSIKTATADMNKKGLRMISLKRLDAAISENVQQGKPLPAEIRYMAGIQRIEYIILQDNDVIVAGPGEAFHADDQGNVVGKQSGMPVIHLEDFLVAMRHVDDARKDYGISVSIDPTEEGVKRHQKLAREMKRRSVKFRPEFASKIEEAYGPQTIRLTGVPKDSRFSQTLVSADYKMKRLSMGLQDTPDFLPSLLEIAKTKNARFREMAPRFWMECNYQPVAVSKDNRVWKIGGQGVKALTEEQYFDKEGNRKSAGKENRLAKRWAETMTERFEDVSKAEPVFRELRNLMDLSVISAIIANENLLQKAKLDIPAINGNKRISTPTRNVPVSVPSQCSFIKLSDSWLVTASGGVTVDSWGVAKNTKVEPALDKIAGTVAKPTSAGWWWNAK